MEKMLNNALKKVDEAEIFSVMTQSCLIRYAGNELSDIINRDLQEFSLRVIKDGRMGTTCGTSYDNSQELLERALLSAKYGEEVTFSFPSEKGVKREIFDGELASKGPEELIQMGDGILEKTLQMESDMSVNLTVQKKVEHKRLMNSSGKDEYFQSTLLNISVTGLLKGSKEGVNRSHISGLYSPFPDDKLTELVGEYRLTNRLCPIPTKKMSLLLTPRAMWAVTYRLKEGISGANVVKGTSPLTDKLGKKIFPEIFNIIDDPTIDYFPNTTPIDDEGVPTRKKYIVEKGVLKNFLFDLSNGNKHGCGSTGNGFKKGLFTSTIFMSPTPELTTLVVEPGKYSYEEMLSNMKEGIILDYPVGAHSGNVLLGDLSANIGIGLYVKDGEILGRAMDSMVSGNIYKFFNNIKMIGNRPEIGEFNQSQYCPHLLFDDISISGTG